MMKFVCLLTKKYEIPTDVSLNTIMVDGTGMYGACRITVEAKHASYAWMVLNLTDIKLDFDEMLKRMGAFKEIERKKFINWIQTNNPKLQKDQGTWWTWCPFGVQSCAKAMKPKERMAIPVSRWMSWMQNTVRIAKEEVNLGLNEEHSHNGSQALSDCPNRDLPEWLPGRNQYSHSLKTSNAENSSKLQRLWKRPVFAGCMWSRLSTRKTMRIVMYTFESRTRSCCHWFWKRFAADYERWKANIRPQYIAEKNGIKIAVIGSGPAGTFLCRRYGQTGLWSKPYSKHWHEIGAAYWNTASLESAFRPTTRL